MNKITRVVAGSLTSIIAVGMLAAPAVAVVPLPAIEVVTCLALAPARNAAGLATAASGAEVEEGITAVEEAKAAIDLSSVGMGSTGLAYIQALDGVGNVTGTLDAFIGAIGDFSEDLTGWIDAVDALSAAGLALGMNESVFNYYNTLCPAAI